VAASKIGQGAMTALQSKGITAMSLPGDVNEALQKIYSYNEIQNLFN
jgi:predicted Fe-Mo cluster-binding NifX family protein